MDKNTKDKIIVEKAELDGKIVALTMFINGLKFPDIDNKQQVLLLSQLESMNDYSSTLRDRLYHENQKVNTDGLVAYYDLENKPSKGQTEMCLDEVEPKHASLNASESHIYDKDVGGWVSVDSKRGEYLVDIFIEGSDNHDPL